MFFKRKKRKGEVDKEWVNQKIGYLYLQLKEEMEKAKTPFFPFRDFYSQWSANDFSLVLMAQKILTYLNEPMGNLVITFRNDLGEKPGLFTMQSGQEFILVNTKYRNDPYAVGAILAHEIMHLYLMSRKHIFLPNAEENELLTDLGTIYLGLGIVVINGMAYKSNWILTALALLAGVLYVKEEKLFFGYFDHSYYSFYLKEYFKINNIQLKEVAKYIHPKSWHFISGLSLRARLNKESIFFKEARKKIIFETIGVFVVLALVIIVGSSWFSSDTQTNYQTNPTAETQIELPADVKNLSAELDNLKSKIQFQENQLRSLKQNLDRYELAGDSYNYNNLVPTYNDLLSQYKANVDLYNQKVNIYNQRIKSLQ